MSPLSCTDVYLVLDFTVSRTEALLYTIIILSYLSQIQITLIIGMISVKSFRESYNTMASLSFIFVESIAGYFGAHTLTL